MTTVKLMEHSDLKGKRVLIRQDLNVPLKDGQISSDARIRASLPTIKYALDQGAAVMIMSHLGRPTEGASSQENSAYSLRPIAEHLSQSLDLPVLFKTDWLNGVEVSPGEVVLLENVRFNKGEKVDDDTLSQKMAGLCDIFVMDAFGTAHRAQASTHGVAKFAKEAVAGPLLAGELKALSLALSSPSKPMTAIVGGSKVSTKLSVLEQLVDVVDQLVVGGGIANTFLAAAGYPIGKSLYEADLIPAAKALIEKTEIPLPTDVVVGKAFSSEEPAVIKKVADVEDDDMIFDIGPDSAQAIAELLKKSKTILWNGPVGVFEFDQFAKGTEILSNAIAQSDAFSLAGGGDTLAAIDKYNIADDVSYISTGGGAFLEYVEGKVLPAVAILESRAR